MSSKNVTYNMDGAVSYGMNQQTAEALAYQQQEAEKIGAQKTTYQQTSSYQQGPVYQQTTYQQSSSQQLNALQQQREHQMAMSGASGMSGAYSTKSGYASNVQMSGPSSLQYNSGSGSTTANVLANAQMAMVPAGSSSYQQQAYMASPASYSLNTQQYGASSSQPSQQVVSGQQYGSSAHYQSGGAAAAMTTSAHASANSTGRYKSETRVVGKEYGEERVISVTQRVDESRTTIVGERYVEHEVRIPKRIVREEIIEKVIIVPEKIIQEEIIEDMAKVQEKIIEVAHPRVIEKIVEVPEYEYVEKVVEVPEIIKQDRIQHVDKVEYQERVQERVKIIPQERIVEVPDVQYREVPVERVVEVAEWRDEVRTREVPVPQYVDKPIQNVVQVDQAMDVERVIPVPVEANITYEFRIPKIKPRYHKITYPVYLPRFIEVPVALELLHGGLLQQTEIYLQQVGSLTKAAASLCEIENLATTIMKADIQAKVSTMDLQSVIMKSWKEGTLNVGGMHTTTSASYSYSSTAAAGGPMMVGSTASGNAGMLRVF